MMPPTSFGGSRRCPGTSEDHLRVKEGRTNLLTSTFAAHAVLGLSQEFGLVRRFALSAAVILLVECTASTLPIPEIAARRARFSG